MVPEAYGGPGGDFLHQSVICEELGYSGQMSTTLQTHSDLISAYVMALGTEEQKKHWLPKMVTGRPFLPTASAWRWRWKRPMGDRIRRTSSSGSSRSRASAAW